ncbi:transposase [Helicobacter pylori]|nr:transposase [Helicobacter pylori]KNE15877.1 transposase [Helicobacter pylori]KNE23686.1 transposase [Helicobacter pylori]KNX44393.1 transposase [Helicobacter pylori]
MDIEASKIAKITRILRVTINKIIKQIRILITKEYEKITQLNEEIEVDES